MPSPFTRVRRLLPSLANDYWRQNVASFAAFVGVAALFLRRVLGDGGIDVSSERPEWMSEVFVTMGLGGWVSFCAIYCWLTHRTFSRMDSSELRARARAAAQQEERWWHAFVGSTDSAGWTVYGAGIATVLVVILARNDYVSEDPAYVFLGMAVAAGSWVLMAYSYALTYMRADADRAALEFPFEEAPVFGDYLSYSVFVSTFLGPQAAVRSREIFSTMRTHALLAFVFNAVVVAMTVSLLFGTLSS